MKKDCTAHFNTEAQELIMKLQAENSELQKKLAAAYIGADKLRSEIEELSDQLKKAYPTKGTPYEKIGARLESPYDLSEGKSYYCPMKKRTLVPFEAWNATDCLRGSHDGVDVFWEG